MKILVVDDDRRIVQTTLDILKIKGYEGMPAHSGEEALEVVRNEPPDCVLMDIRMPGMSGIEAMKEMKKIIPDLPIVLVSAYTTEEIEEEAKQAGAYAVLSKPLNLQMVLSFLSLLRKEESILVVDDDPNFCRTLKDVLVVKGYHVQTECTPEHVLEDMEKEYKLVVVLDLKLGEDSGVDLLQKIREKYPNKPVVLVTGYRKEMGDVIEKGLKIGAYTYLYKPLEMEELYKLIEEIRVQKLQHLLN